MRTISSTPRRYDSNNGATKDPSHPNLYYHPSGRSTILSFLPHTPVQGSSTILGSLPEGGELGDFQEEPKFLQVFPYLLDDELIGRKVLHSTIKEGLRLGKGETVEFEAATRPSDGYIHITGESLQVSRMELTVDERAIPPAGRIGETEDLIGSVFVKDGKVCHFLGEREAKRTE